MKAWQLITHRGTSRTYRRLRSPLSEGDREECGSFHYRPYSDSELRQLAARVPKDAETYVMFNNIPRVADSQRFVRIAG